MASKEHPTGLEPRLDLGTVRQRLAERRGRGYWKSLEELAATPEFEELLFREFPRQASEWAGGETSRRRFLQLGGASLALGGLTGCVAQPPEKIVPYVSQPEEIVPGKPLYFATATTLGGYATGVLAESNMGRPIKVEGNPEHPASLGATDLFTQASILDLYDPDRLQAVSEAGRARSWEAFSRDLSTRLQALGALSGEGLAILTPAFTSPTLAAQLADLLEWMPNATWHAWEPAGRHAAQAGNQALFGRPVEARYDLSRASVVLALDSDFLTRGPGAVRYARDLAHRRRVWREEPAGGGTESVEMLRLYAVESELSATGSVADHRLPLPPSGVEAFAVALAAELGVAGSGADVPHPEGARWVSAVAADLRTAGAGALVVPGEEASPRLHVLAHAINTALGAAGSTVLYGDPVVVRPPQAAPEVSDLRQMEELTARMRAGDVDALIVLGGNPAYDAPADLDFAAALERVPFAVYHGLYDNETASYCRWVIPATHELESWSDARAFDGTASIVQPLIEPLYRPAKTVHQVIAALAGDLSADAFELVREHWRGNGLAEDAAWRRALHDGVIPGTAAEPQPVTVDPTSVAEAAGAPFGRGGVGAASGGPIEVAFRADPTLWDGRFANNGWLQECPKPISKLTWDNPLLISPRDAEARGLASGDLVELTVGGDRSLTVPVFVQPGQAPGSATFYLGSGRTRAGRVGTDCGFDAYRLRDGSRPWSASATLTATGGDYPLACTQDHWSMEGRHLVRSGTLEAYRHHPEFAQHETHVPAQHESMYPEHEYNGYAWAMAIDLSACTGCSACVVACQAENNIPIVGKEQVVNAREMHWLRIDRYYAGDLDDPEVLQQPVACQHCENAPCEVVCPVAATVHSDEGLNDMIYNRCVGTRYCSNNCPYKVRRFNFFKWVDTETEVLKLARNPDVTVRGRGVMEKCSYCVQRINHARGEAKVEGRSIRDGEILTACQQVCPSDAIVFGDQNDEGSQVRLWKDLPLSYGLLAELNTRPRTEYLARVTNPNPELARPAGGDDPGGGHEESH